MWSACSLSRVPTRLCTRASASPTAFPSPNLQSDRRLILFSGAATLLQTRLQHFQLTPSRQTNSSPSPAFSLAYLDPSICVSAAYPKEFYLEKLRTSERLARQQLGDLLEREAYSGLSNGLVLEAFNDMRQAAFYLPCALAHESVELANQAQADYLLFLKQCRTLDTTSRAAANARADHEEVEEALAMVWEAAEDMMKLCY